MYYSKKDGNSWAIVKQSLTYDNHEVGVGGTNRPTINKPRVLVKEANKRFRWWLSGLRIWSGTVTAVAHVTAVSLIPGPGTSACFRYSQKKKKKQTNKKSMTKGLHMEKEQWSKECMLIWKISLGCLWF